MPRPPFFKAISLLVFALLAACAEGKRNSGGGVVDGGGGGDLIYNSREEVLEAVDQAWRLMISETPANPIYHAYEKLDSKRNRNAGLEKDEEFIHGLLEKILSGPHPIPPKPSNSAEFELKNIDYLAEKKLNLLEEDLCSGPGDHKFLASVTKLNRNGEICVSVKALRNLPTGNLRRDLIALFAHEIAHLNGADENTARIFQKFFIKSMSQLLRESKDELKTSMINDFRDKILLQWLGMIPRKYDKFGKSHLATTFEISHKLGSLAVPDPYIGQDLGVARPELYLKVKKRAAKLSSYFYALAVGTLKDRTDPLNQRDLRKLRRLGLDLVDLATDWNLYLTGQPLHPWYQETVLAATDPRTLSDPSRRPNLGGTGCPDCRGVGPALRRENVSEEESRDTNERFQRDLRRRLQPYIDELEREASAP